MAIYIGGSPAEGGVPAGSSIGEGLSGFASVFAGTVSKTGSASMDISKAVKQAMDDAGYPTRPTVLPRNTGISQVDSGAAWNLPSTAAVGASPGQNALIVQTPAAVPAQVASPGSLIPQTTTPGGNSPPENDGVIADVATFMSGEGGALIAMGAILLLFLRLIGR